MQRFCGGVLACYAALAALFYWVCGEQLHERISQSDMPAAADATGELIKGEEIRQAFSVDGDTLLGISLVTAPYGRENTSQLAVSVENPAGERVGGCMVPAAQLDNGVSEIAFLPPVPVEAGERYTLVFSSPDAASGNAISLMYGRSVALARREAPLDIPDWERARINGQPVEGRLCVQLTSRKRLWIGDAYVCLALAAGLLLALYCGYVLRQERRGRQVLALRLLTAFKKYQFLIRQLVARDFKTKYKRSVLGILWSFLNPVLTMAVQYGVFSTLFRSDIPNFALYLLIGIVCFNFFSEAVSAALTSIVGNAGLITKVYVPKYIYPLSRVLSCGVNLLFSLIPLFAAMLLTGAPVRPALLLLPFGLCCLFLLSLGVGLLLAAAMVFFRDTQFLWGVASMLWMYLTPIIYPESIIPAQVMGAYRCNPLYPILRFIRTVMMQGISPEPGAYLRCLLAGIVPLAIGAAVFQRQQDKFVVNL